MNFTSPLFLIGFPLVCLLFRWLGRGTPEVGRRPQQQDTPEVGRRPRQQDTPEVGRHPQQQGTPEVGRHPQQQGTPEVGRRRQALLLAASWLFYMGGSLKCFPLLAAVTLITYLGGIAIENARIAEHGQSTSPERSKACLSLTLACVFAILFFFKYLGFVQDNILHLPGIGAPEIGSRRLNLPLPPGISFYTFQSLSYCIDIYRGKIEAERKFHLFALFVSFFPQLVAGPIERAGDLLPQLKAARSPQHADTLAGVICILRGFFKKIVIADFLSVYVSALFDSGQKTGPVTILAGVLFGFQIYADFSGYSDIALGAARLLGIRLTENFRSPYLADSIREFWRRWHITLTRWFTDYVYIPLGGNRRGTAVHVRNILIVFLLSGFWHGADWHFAAWGLYHGALLACSVLWDKASRKEPAATASDHNSPAAEQGLPLKSRRRPNTEPKYTPPRLLRTALTFLLTSLGWVLFRASSVRQALAMYAALATGWNDLTALKAAFLSGGIPVTGAALVRIAAVPVLLYLLRDLPEMALALEGPGPEEHETGHSRVVLLQITAFLMADVILIAWLGNLAGGTGNAFIYFQF